MAEEQDQDDKTEDPTARRMEKAREDGQVPCSQDASTAAVTRGLLRRCIMAAYLRRSF